MDEVNDAQAKMRIPFIMTVILALLLAVTVFLPYAEATEEERENLMDAPDEIYISEIGMTRKEAVNLSLAEYGRVYMETAREGIHKGVSIACVTVILMFFGFSLLTLILALFKKPVGVMISDILALLVFRVIHFDFEDRGVIPSYAYDWGAAIPYAWVMGILVLGLAVWLLVTKIRYKKCIRRVNNNNKKSGGNEE